MLQLSYSADMYLYVYKGENKGGECWSIARRGVKRARAREGGKGSLVGHVNPEVSLKLSRKSDIDDFASSLAPV